MDIFQSFILSIVEGVTEFLPISSTGHLTLAAELLKVEQSEFVKSFEIFIQLGAILAIVLLYFEKLLKNRQVWKKILLSFIPSAIVGLTLYKPIKQFLIGNTTITLITLFFGGVALIALEKIYNEQPHYLESIERLSWKKAILIGLAQSISVIPGVSRAGATIFGGMFLGLQRKTAVEFSFLLAIPTMLAAATLDLVKSELQWTPNELLLLGVGFSGALVTAFITAKYFLHYIQHHTFIGFGVYRIILAILFWLVLRR